MNTSRKLRTAARCCCVILLLALVLTLAPAGGVKAAETAEVQRLNVMLVIDGSGSLKRTDPTGLRYDALNLFLALLTNSGNNVGAIVFNEGIKMETGIDPISGKDAKMELSKKISDAAAGGDTDIGGALLLAVEKAATASQDNGLNSVVLLFSDGRTEITTDGNSANLIPEAMEQSYADQESAIKNAQTAGIPIYSICLNTTDESVIEEPQAISDRTSGVCVPVSKAEDLTSAFETFYSLIFPGTSSNVKKETFPDSGELEFEIPIPSYGAEEVNIILNTTGLTGKQIETPSRALSVVEIEASTMSGGFYDVIKLVDPEDGMWNISLQGTPGTEVTINVLYNIDSAVELKTADVKTDYDVGGTVTFQANLIQQGQVVTDSAVTNEYSAALTLTNLATGEEKTVEMIPGANGCFEYTMTGDDYCSWTASVQFSYSNLTLSSNELSVNFGNTAPVVLTSNAEITATVTPISGKEKSLNVSGFFTDAQDPQLTYTIESSQLVKGTYKLDPATGELVVNTGESKSGNVIIRATDSMGAWAEMTVTVDVTNMTTLIFILLVALVLAGLIILFVIVWIATHKPWKGMLTITNLATGVQRSHGGFRGKLPLLKMGVRGCGIEGTLVATGSNRIELRTRQPVYNSISMQPSKKIPLMNGFNEIYADEMRSQGIEISIEGRR